MLSYSLSRPQMSLSRDALLVQATVLLLVDYGASNSVISWFVICIGKFSSMSSFALVVAVLSCLEFCCSISEGPSSYRTFVRLSVLTCMLLQHTPVSEPMSIYS